MEEEEEEGEVDKKKKRWKSKKKQDSCSSTTTTTIKSVAKWPQSRCSLLFNSMASGPGKPAPQMSQKLEELLFQSMAPRSRKPPENYQKRVPMFFKFMLPGFSQKLSLPPAFLKHLMGEKCHKAILKSSLGKSWHVKVCGDKACKWFGDGWFDFVQWHDLQIGECLVFRYDGDMVFDVTIFDKSACEKKLPLVKKDDKDHGNQKGMEDEKRQPLVLKKDKDNGKQRGQHTSTVKFNSFKKIKTEVVEMTIYKTYSIGAHHFSEKQPSTTEGTMKAFEEANAFLKASKFPNFLKIMTKSNAGYCFVLNVPRCFFREHLPKEKTKVFLWDPKEREWEVIFTPCGHRGSLTAGWCAFSRANDLREGDVCIFELVGECQMQVHIFPLKRPPSAQSKRQKKRSR